MPHQRSAEKASVDTAVLAASAPRGALLAADHDAADVAFVSRALAHLRTSAELGRMMRAEGQADPAYRKAADRLLIDQGGRIAVLEAMLGLWEAPAAGVVHRIDGAHSTTDQVDLDLLAGQVDSSGFAPFWVMVVSAHQDAFIDEARAMRREATSPDVRRFAAAFSRHDDELREDLEALGA